VTVIFLQISGIKKKYTLDNSDFLLHNIHVIKEVLFITQHSQNLENRKSLS